MDGHRHGPGPEHDYEPVLGLPEPLPAGERMLWQGAPDARSLARRVFHVRKVAVYFGVVGALQVAGALADGEGLREALGGLTLLVSVAALAIGLLVLLAQLSARTTLYTITDRRVVMRVGIVLTMTFNLPFSRIASAGLRQHGDGTGDLPLELGEASIGYAHLWPHARPWRLGRPEPMLRCVPDAQRVGRLLADAWSQSTGGSVRAMTAATADEGASRQRPDSQTALAGR